MKRLPRDEQGNFARAFSANGRKYIILTQEEGVGIKRYSTLLSMSATVTFEMNAATLVMNLNKILEMLWSMMQGRNKLADLVAHVKSMIDGIQRTSRREYQSVFWTCCLFIVREGEDMKKFVEADQREKIDDWAEEGYHEEEFYELVKKKLVEFSTPSSENKRKAGNGVPLSSASTAS